MANLRTVNLTTPQERNFKIQLKNDSVIEFKFAPIATTDNQLWQMFATTEALDALEQLIAPATEEVVVVADDATETRSARKSEPAKKK
jgi:hypothetical protein